MAGLGGLNTGNSQPGRDVLMYDAYAQAVSIPAKTDSEYNSSTERPPKRLSVPHSDPCRATDISPELHSGPMNLAQCAITKIQGAAQRFTRSR
jgi:hypothetical protein